MISGAGTTLKPVTNSILISTPSNGLSSRPKTTFPMSIFSNLMTNSSFITPAGSKRSPLLKPFRPKYPKRKAPLSSPSSTRKSRAKPLQFPQRITSAAAPHSTQSTSILSTPDRLKSCISSSSPFPHRCRKWISNSLWIT